MNIGEKELAELKIEKEDNCKLYREQQQRTADLIEEKGNYITTKAKSFRKFIKQFMLGNWG